MDDARAVVQRHNGRFFLTIARATGKRTQDLSVFVYFVIAVPLSHSGS
jgi:hypothetical protein